MSAPKLLAEWFWIERWDGSAAAALPLLARGLYREMLTRAWRLGGWLPADHATIQRLVRVTPSEWAKAWPSVERYWHPDLDDPSKLVNDTQREVMADFLARREKAAEHGRRAARARHEQRSGNARAQPEDQPPVSGRRSHVLRTTDNEKNPVAAPPSLDGEPEPEPVEPLSIRRPRSVPRTATAQVWNTEGAEIWYGAYGGPPPKAFFAQLQPIQARHGWERVKPVLAFYLAQTEPEFCAIGKFGSAFLLWEERSRGGSATSKLGPRAPL